MIWLPVVGKWADIDVYASTIAYTDLLNQREKPAKAYIPSSAPNYSIPDTLRIKAAENNHFNLQPNDQVIILDISIPEVIHKFVPNQQILELIDHHPGYEEYWREHLGNKAIIEKIGAVATSIFEWWGECWDYSKMSPKIAKLLLAAILDNTLNFNADITTKRDHRAAEKLAKIAQTSLSDFTTWYFQEIERNIVEDFQSSILNDIKIVKSPINHSDFAFGQLTAWDAKFILTNTDKIQRIMNQNHQIWLLNILNISEKHSYILSNSSVLTEYFNKLLKLNQKEGISISNQLFLRKEIMAKMLAKS